jgi:hypothetical protein
MTGMGIFGPYVRYYAALGASTTIFQAEMYAINVCARICQKAWQAIMLR